MTMLDTLNKKTMIALMIAATGLSTSMASAQFKVDYSAKADTGSVTKADKSVFVIKSHDDEHSYEVKIVDGEIIIAKIDGDDVDDDQVKIKGEVVIFISDDGETLHELQLPSANQTTNHKRVWVTSSGNKFPGGNDHSNLRSFFSSDNDNHIDGTVVPSPPKVMLGINLGEPSKILRKHLNLKEGIRAILIESVIKGLPAALSGLEDFDVIVSIDGSDQADGELLRKILAEKDAGDIMKLIVLRSGEKLKIKVELAEYNAKELGTSSNGGKIYYDDQEGYEEIREKIEATRNHAKNIEFELLTKLEDGEFGHMQKGHLANLKVQLHDHLAKAADKHLISVKLHAQALDAMKVAERQLVEFQDGRLTVRSFPGVTGRIQHIDRFLPQAMNSHMDGMEARFSALESRIDHQIDEMGEQMDRLMNMFDRLMDRLEKNDD
ncbi:hypothetical protein COB72_07055 [bacterium]|nr:MAG: hypothetical protein COB72_07055 [bacterium]